VTTRHAWRAVSNALEGTFGDHGLDALSDRSRRPIRYANQLPVQIESLIVRCTQEKPHWGARKIRELLVRRLDGDFRGQPRARSTPFCTGVAWSKGSAGRDAGLRVRRCRKGSRLMISGAPAIPSPSPAPVAEPELALEVRPPLSLRSDVRGAGIDPREDLAVTTFEQLFRERGLPSAIRSDNGVPFVSPNGLFNLSKLSVWRLRLGIAIDQARPSSAKRPPRAHASHAQEGGGPASRDEQPSAARPI
jgi:putative transposase